jgi:transposase-like protein
MNCPKCDVELIKVKEGKQRDGTKFIEFRCPECRKRFMDLKIPYSTFGLQRRNSTSFLGEF